MNDEPKAPRGKRPVSITMICIINLIAFLILIFLPFLICQSHSFSSMQQLCFENISNIFDETPFFLPWIIALCIITIGLWRMKKWAAYTYILWQAQDLATDELNLRSLVIKGLIINCVSRNISKMS